MNRFLLTNNRLGLKAITATVGTTTGVWLSFSPRSENYAPVDIKSWSSNVIDTAGGITAFNFWKPATVNEILNTRTLSCNDHKIMALSPSAENLAPRETTTKIQLDSNGIKPVADLFVPTFQAAVRAARLVGTVSSMVYDYKSAEYANRLKDAGESFVLKCSDMVSSSTRDATNNNEGLVESSGLKTVKEVTSFLKFVITGEMNDDKDDNIEQKRKYWEKMVVQRRKELEMAQEAYAGDGSTSPKKKSDTNKLEVENSAQADNGDEEVKNPLVEKEKRRIANEKNKEWVHTSAKLLSEAESELEKLGDRGSVTHQKAAERLLDLCRINGGVYIKIGQHLANLDYIIPSEYVNTLSALFDDAPCSEYSDVREVIKEELGYYPEEVYESFSEQPIASASLAQVHTARERGTGRKLAIKVQHRGLRETSVGDLFALTLALRVVESLFDEFRFGWIGDEIAPNLPKELDFVHEGRNAERAAAYLKDAHLDKDCIIPEVFWVLTTARVLTMQFEEGFKSTDINSIDNAGLKRCEVSKLIASVFNAQVFLSGFVHCDPHPANVLLRPHPDKKGKPQIVLVDHGLYKEINNEFRISYARLWKSLMLADIPGIKESCKQMNVTKMYPLLAAMLTARPFDEMMERAKTGKFDVDSGSDSNDSGTISSTSADKAMIRGYAQRFLGDIIKMLDTVPRQMLLLLKMNDCLRHVDYALGSPANTLVVAGKYAANATYEHDREQQSGEILKGFKVWLSYLQILARIQLYELLTSRRAK